MKKIFFVFSFCWNLLFISPVFAQQFAPTFTYTITAEDVAVAGFNIQALIDSGRAVQNANGSYTIYNVTQEFMDKVEQTVVNARLSQIEQQKQDAANQYRENTTVFFTPPTPSEDAPSSQKPSSPSNGSNPQNNNSSSQSDNNSSSSSGGGANQSSSDSQSGGGSGSGELYGGGTATTLFEHLITSVSEVFRGLKLIIYAVAGLSIVAIAIGAFFGNLNWKWLSSIIICLLLISAMQGVLNYLTKNNVNSAFKLDDTIESAAPRSDALK